LLTEHLLRPQPTRWKVVKVEIDTPATISEAHLEAAGAGYVFVLFDADNHGRHRNAAQVRVKLSITGGSERALTTARRVSEWRAFSDICELLHNVRALAFSNVASAGAVAIGGEGYS
jgi:hypothetical protein